MAKSHLNTNKQFMIGNGILAFAVIIVVVIFVYMSLRLSRDENAVRSYKETYSVMIDGTLTGDSLQIFVNDSVIYDGAPEGAGHLVTVNRFAEENSLLVVDRRTDYVSTFPLSESGETVLLSVSDSTIVRK